MKIIKTFQPIEISVSDYNVEHCGSCCKFLDVNIPGGVAFCNLYKQFLYNENELDVTNFLKLNRCEECLSNIGSKISELCDNCEFYMNDICNECDSLWNNSIKPDAAQCEYFSIWEK